MKTLRDRFDTAWAKLPDEAREILTRLAEDMQGPRAPKRQATPELQKLLNYPPRVSRRRR